MWAIEKLGFGIFMSTKRGRRSKFSLHCGNLSTNLCGSGLGAHICADSGASNGLGCKCLQNCINCGGISCNLSVKCNYIKKALIEEEHHQYSHQTPANNNVLSQFKRTLATEGRCTAGADITPAIAICKNQLN